MATPFTVFKGSPSGTIVEGHGSLTPSPTEAIIQLSHCGVCGTDEHYRHAPMGLGHEGVGTISVLGSEASKHSDLKIGDRVGLGWRQSFCGYCKPCLLGASMHCENGVQFGGGNLDQGCFGTAVAWDVSAVVKIPEEISSEDAGPLMCGGATVWGPLYQHGLKAGDRIGVVGVGGLGHLAIKFASKMGMEVVVFSSTESKKEEALKFGASEFVATKGLTTFEGIKPIDALLITAGVQPDYALYQTVMAKLGKIFPLTISFAAEPIPMLPLITKGLSIIGSAGAHRYAFEPMMRFAAKHNIRPQIEKFPMTQEGIMEAMQKLKDGKMRYRGVVEVQK